MATILNKELAEKMVDKLQARKITTKNKAHDEYAVEHNGRLIGIISIRRGSSKSLGHDYIPRELNISPGQAKRLGQCPWKREDFIRCLQEKGIIPPDPPPAQEG